METDKPKSPAKSKRLEILKASLVKKESAFDAKLSAHIADVRSANGQPLNDKRNGASTVGRWAKQEGAMRSLKDGIEVTKAAIEREESAVAVASMVLEELPASVLARIESGELTQWRKHPETFFVAGVDRARIVWVAKSRVIAHRYANEIADPEQRRKFARVFNELSESVTPEGRAS
jgi:hypothetical protein